MKNSLLKELFLIVISLIPIVYLGINYSALPETVATHFNIEGVADGFSHKSQLWIFILLFSVLGYGLMLILPKIDQKKNLDKFESTFASLRFAIGLLMSFISCFIVYSAKKGGGEGSISFMLIVVSLVIAFIGNYLQTVKPNYVIGIRTPWTLSDEEVWKKTHNFGGKLMFFSGIVTAILLFLVPKTLSVPIFMVGIVGTTFMSIFYSYYISKK